MNSNTNNVENTEAAFQNSTDWDLKDTTGQIVETNLNFNLLDNPFRYDTNESMDPTEMGTSGQNPLGKEISNELSQATATEDTATWCVKVFGFNGENSWADMGTGITNIDIIVPDNGDMPVEYNDSDKQLILTVSSKEMTDINVALDYKDGNIDLQKQRKFRGSMPDDDSIILKVNLKNGVGYAKQNHTIISWYQDDIEEDLAISFQDQWDCFSTFQKICKELNLDYVPEINMPERNHLSSILTIISSQNEEYYDLQFSAFSNDPSYLSKQYQTFYQCEQKKDYEGLRLCAKIVRTLLVTKMMVLVSILLDDKNYSHVFAILEYDDSNQPPNQASQFEANFQSDDVNIGFNVDKDQALTPIKSYREFCEQSNHIILPCLDDQTINFIKMRFRFIFLKDFIFAICSEELLGLLHYRLVIQNTTILECLLKSDCIKTLISKSYHDQKNFSNFLTELLGLIKLTSNSIINNFPQYVIDNNLLDIIIKNIHLVLKIEEDEVENTKMVNETVAIAENEDPYKKLKNCLDKEFTLSFVERNYLMALIEIQAMVVRSNGELACEKLMKTNLELIFFKVMRINDSTPFDVQFEQVCPNFDPLFLEPNMSLIEHLISYCSMLNTYLDSKKEQGVGNKSEQKSEIIFQTRLTMFIYKILKFGNKCLQIKNCIKESSQISTLFKCSELYVDHPHSKHLLILVMQLQKLVYALGDESFCEVLLSSDIMFKVQKKSHDAKIRKENLIYSQILDFLKLFNNTINFTFNEDYVQHFEKNLETFRSENQINSILTVYRNIRMNKSILDDTDNDNKIASLRANSSSPDIPSETEMDNLIGEKDDNSDSLISIAFLDTKKEDEFFSDKFVEYHGKASEDQDANPKITREKEMKLLNSMDGVMNSIKSKTKNANIEEEDGIFSDFVSKKKVSPVNKHMESIENLTNEFIDKISLEFSPKKLQKSEFSPDSKFASTKNSKLAAYEKSLGHSDEKHNYNEDMPHNDDEVLGKRIGFIDFKDDSESELQKLYESKKYLLKIPSWIKM